jgi:hypothetical protein
MNYRFILRLDFNGVFSLGDASLIPFDEPPIYQNTMDIIDKTFEML